MANFQLCVTAPLAVFALFVGLAPSTVHGHGYLIQPKTSFTGYGGGYSAIVQNSTLTPPAGKRFIWFQDQIAGIFEAALKPTGKSLKNFILENQDTSVQAEGAPKPHSAACGYSLPNGAPQDLPDKLQWKMDFLHPGPCEVYCDDELVVPYTTDCWTKFSDNMIPYNKAKCVGKKQLTLYFLAVHYPPWQVYINCVPLKGTSSGSVASDATPAPVATTKAPATNAPTPMTPAATKAKPTTTTMSPMTAAKPMKTKKPPTTRTPMPMATSMPVTATPTSPPPSASTTDPAASTIIPPSKLCNIKSKRKL